jgi:hypothetical protein
VVIKLFLEMLNFLSNNLFETLKFKEITREGKIQKNGGNLGMFCFRPVANPTLQSRYPIMKNIFLII